MNPLPFIAVILSWITLSLGCYVYAKNSSDHINRLFLVTSLAATYWTFAEFGLQQAETFETAYFWHRIGSFWPLSVASLTHFFLAVTEQKGSSNARLSFFLIYIPSLGFSLLSGTMDLLTGVPKKTGWGWIENPPENPIIFYISVIWAYILGIMALILCLRYYTKLTDYKKKKQTNYVILGLAPPMLSGVTTEVILPSFGIQFPELTAHAFALSCIIIGYAMLKYQLFVLTPATAADDILATMSDILFLVNPDGTIQRVNQATINVLGFQERELIGHSFTKFFADKKSTTTIFQGLRRDDTRGPAKIDDIEMNLKTKYGHDQTITVSLSNSIIKDKNGDLVGILYLARDITERKKAKEELESLVKERTGDLKRVNEQLRESEAKYSALVEQAYDSVVIVQDEIFRFANRAAANLTGYTIDELIGMPFVDIVTPESRKLLAKRYKARMDGEKVPPVYEFKMLRKDGIIKDVEISAGIIQYQGRSADMGIGRNITERKQLSIALQESELRYRQLFEESPISLWEEDYSAVKRYLDELRTNGVKDFRNHFEKHPEFVPQCIELIQVVDVNKASLQLYKAQNKEALKNGLNKIICKETYDVFIERLIALTEGNMTFEAENINKTLKDEKINVNLRLSVVPGYEDTWEKILVSLTDISLRKRAEKAQQDLDARRTNFIEITSHELRTPLTAIRGYVELLEHRLFELNQARRKQSFEILKRNIRRLERLIAGVSALGQLERGSFQLNIQKLDLFTFLNEALTPYQTFLKSQLEVKDCFESGLVFINGDPDRLLQVLDNLLENAIKQTSPHDRKIQVTSEIQPQVVTVRITDNGAGIPPEDFIRIFEPFIAISTQYSAGGTGIGLYISRMIVEAHGGSLNAYSLGKGQGATFVLELPCERTKNT